MNTKINLSLPLCDDLKKKTMARLKDKIFVDEKTCWNWIGKVKDNGYAQIYINKKFYYVHRISYAVFIGVIPEGLTIDHLCKNRRCLNPSHMEVVSLGENALRGESSAAQNARKKTCKSGHKLEPLPPHRITTAKRHCPICERIAALRWNKEHRDRKNENNRKYHRSPKGLAQSRKRYQANRDNILRQAREADQKIKKQQEAA